MPEKQAGYGDWDDERRREIREKERRGEELTHSERMSLAIDEGIQ